MEEEKKISSIIKGLEQRMKRSEEKHSEHLSSVRQRVSQSLQHNQDKVQENIRQLNDQEQETMMNQGSNLIRKQKQKMAHDKQIRKQVNQRKS